MGRNFSCESILKVGKKEYHYFDLKKLENDYPGKISRLPYSQKILLENLLRFDDGSREHLAATEALIHWDSKTKSSIEISFMPARVVMQDFTGVPAIVDLAVMRDAMKKLGGDPKKINPILPVDLVIDHSVQVDAFGNSEAFRYNVEKEYERNKERYTFLRWGQQSFNNLRVVPPGTGIVHQVNLEYLANVIWTSTVGKKTYAYPDTLVGTDSHTTMINGLAVLGWGVGGIEAEAAMLGQPFSMLIPEVIGFRLEGKLPEGATATDLVLTVTQMLRKKGVVDKFVEFYGSGVAALSLADRATISNMAPEYGATCGLFPMDQETINYMGLTARPEETLQLVEAYGKAQGMFGSSPANKDGFDYSDTLSLNLHEVEPSLAGPKRPQDRFALKNSKAEFAKSLAELNAGRPAPRMQPPIPVSIPNPALLPNEDDEPKTMQHFKLNHGAVAIAAITSCTNTSNPAVMLAAGLVAKKAVDKGLRRAPWAKTSLAPGSKVVTDYLAAAGLQAPLDQLGFNLVGYGCTTCIGNSGPLPETIAHAVTAADLVVCAVLSGNRNFEGRINPHVRASYLMSPPLVVVYAIAGRMDIDLYNEPLGSDSQGKKVFLKDIWPSSDEVAQALRAVESKMFAKEYSEVFKGDDLWRKLPAPKGDRYAWDDESTYIKAPPFFTGISATPAPLKSIHGMRVLAWLGDSVTTDHISPAGNISAKGPAGEYLVSKGVTAKDFNSYGARRGNYEVMVRGTFANIRLRNLMLGGSEGGVTQHIPTKTEMSIYEAADKYQASNTPLLIIAGKEYGSGSSRDWAAKGPCLQGVKVVVAESFERIHRSNLIGMGILPLQFMPGETPKTLGLTGFETYDLLNLDSLNGPLQAGQHLDVVAKTDAGKTITFKTIVRINTPRELEYYQNGGILHYVLRSLSKDSKK